VPDWITQMKKNWRINQLVIKVNYCFYPFCKVTTMSLSVIIAEIYSL
jgi:hypothetical protein